MPTPSHFIPYARLARRLFSGPGSLEQIAGKREVLCAEEEETVEPPVFIPGQLERVTEQRSDRWGGKTKRDAIAEATSTIVMHAATIAYHLRNAALFDGCIYLKHFKYPVSESSLFKSLRRNCNLERAALASSFLGTKYFGHWLTDDTTRYLLAQDAGLPLCVRMPAYGHRAAYEKYFSQDWTPSDRAYIDNLVIFQDYSQNSFKAKRYKVLRERLKGHVRRAGDHRYIYLRRGQSGVSRTIANEQQIIEALTKQGFEIVDVVSDRLEDIIKALLGARIVISIEGSHIAHCTLAVPESSGLLVLEPPDRFSGVHRAQAGSLGIRFGFVVGLSSDTGYVFSVSEILQTTDLLLQKIDYLTAL